jgi:hypothetical protein
MIEEKVTFSFDDKKYVTRIVYLAQPGDNLYSILHLFGSGPPVLLKDKDELREACEKRIPEFTAKLARELESFEFDYMISPPSSRKGTYTCQAYLEEIQRRQPSLVDLSSYLKRQKDTWQVGGVEIPIRSGRGNAPVEVLMESMVFEAPPQKLKEKAEVLIVDDCLSSGKTATVVMTRVSEHLKNPSFTIAVPVLALPLAANPRVSRVD